MADSLHQQASTGAAQTTTAATNISSKNNTGSDEWSQMSEDQKQQTFDALPEEKKQGKSYSEWIAEGYQHQKENWMPWIEDLYLRWFTKDNKASYATKDTLNKTKVTGVEPVDNLQDGVNNTVAGQIGQGGLLQPVGDAVSKEGVNRAERGGKDDSGSYGGPAAGVTDSAVNNVKAVGGGAAESAKSAGGYVGGLYGGGKKGE